MCRIYRLQSLANAQEIIYYNQDRVLDSKIFSISILDGLGHVFFHASFLRITIFQISHEWKWYLLECSGNHGDRNYALVKGKYF